MRKKIAMILFITVIAFSFWGCSSDTPSEKDDGKLEVVATLFPQYDFAKIVGGDKVNVTKLLPAGVESHSYEPNPSDVIKINDADFFLYTGNIMEPWAATIIDGVNSTSLTVVDVSENVPLLRHEEEEDTEDAHYGADPHIWTDPTRAMIMVDNIASAFGEKDPTNKEYYQTNAENYKKDLGTLDEEIKSIVADGKRDKLIFGGRFAFLYFTEHYNLDYDAAFDSCAESGEPSAKKIAELMDEIKEEKIPVVYYEELSSTKVPQSIVGETGGEILLLHSCHNVTDKEMEKGVTYLNLMEQNAKNLEKGLN